MDHNDILSVLEQSLGRIMDLEDMYRGDDCSSDGESGSLILEFPGGNKYTVSFKPTK